MQRTRAEDEEEIIFCCELPPEIWLKVIGYVEKDDMVTHLALLGVHSSFVLYVSEVLDLFIARMSNCFHKRKKEELMNVPLRLNDPRQIGIFLAENVDDWLRDAWLSKASFFTKNSNTVKTARKIVYRYTSKCLVDERYKTAEHWSTLLSFLHLCQQYCRYAPVGALDVLSIQDVVSTLFRVEKATNRVTPLWKSPTVKTIDLDDTPWKHLEDLRKHALDVVERKYQKKTAKLYLYREILESLHNETYLLSATVYDILKDELKLRQPLEDDPLSLVVIENEHGRTQHIMTEMCRTHYKSSDLVNYTQGDEHALAIMLALKRNEHAICDKVFERFTRKIEIV